MYITNGTVTINSYDDGINSARDMHIQGGNITVVAKNNDAIDSNGNLYIEGGTLIACGASGAECGLDAAEQYKLYITGGTVLAIGGSNNAVSSTTNSQYVVNTSNLSVSANSTITLKKSGDSSAIATFTVPSTYSSSSSGNQPFSVNTIITAPGGGSMGGQGRNILISTPDIVSGTYTITSGSSSANATSSKTTSSGMGF